MEDLTATDQAVAVTVDRAANSVGGWVVIFFFFLLIMPRWVVIDIGEVAGYCRHRGREVV